jgi:hypothetical protein
LATDRPAIEELNQMPRLSKRALRDQATAELGQTLARLDWADRVDLLTTALAYHLAESFPQGLGVEVVHHVLARLLDATHNASWEDGFDAARTEEETFAAAKDRIQKATLAELPNNETPH